MFYLEIRSKRLFSSFFLIKKYLLNIDLLFMITFGDIFEAANATQEIPVRAEGRQLQSYA